jgi:phenylacetate-CoA ligase
MDHYGQNEGVAMAMECLHGKMHIIPEAGIWEILREDGSVCAPGETGEIVGTSLINDAMPLIRYRTGDYAAWAKDQSCSCGNQQPIISSLEGRVDDYLIAVDGRKIGRLSSAFSKRSTIHSAQIVQDSPGHAYLLIRPGEGYRPSDAISVRDDILERIGDFDFEILTAPQLLKTPQGKTVLVVRLMDRPTLKRIYEEIIHKIASRETAV